MVGSVSRSRTSTEALSAPRRAFESVRHTGLRALVWDAKNTSSVLVARALRARGWAVDWIGPATSPWGLAGAFDGERIATTNYADEILERVLWEHPLDALFLHGDDQVRWLLARWARLPPSIRRHLPEAAAFETALSKERSMQLARSLGVPVLESERCTSPANVAAASLRLAPGGEVVVKGEGGSAGSAVRACRSGAPPSAPEWRAVARHSPVVLVQRRLRGPRLIVTVVYEHGTEHAACAHEKLHAWPFAFGPTAFGVTRRVEVVHDYAQRVFAALRWHGIANIEFRQDLDDGRWYFMEINPRVPSSIGIQALAGVDVAATWAATCAGRGAEEAPGRAYRDGARYAWAVPGLALALRRPWSAPLWAPRCLLSPSCDLEALEPQLRNRALRLGFWLARHT